MMSNQRDSIFVSNQSSHNYKHQLSAVDPLTGTRGLDPRYHADIDGRNDTTGVTYNDPDYVSVHPQGSTTSHMNGMRSRHTGTTRKTDKSSDRQKQNNIRLVGTRIKAAGPVDPELYLTPVRRESICDIVMRFFGFR